VLHEHLARGGIDDEERVRRDCGCACVCGSCEDEGGSCDREQANPHEQQG
jgi:hypothetical protein